jgi:DNA-binding beta-propeller fold protein YncE
VFLPFIILFLLPIQHRAADKFEGFSQADSITFEVVWIGQFSSSDDFTDKESFSDKVLNFLFGSNIQRLFRPLSVITKGDGTIFVLDQGSQSLVMINKKEGEIKSKSGFPSLVGMCLNESEEILFTDSALERIFIQTEDSEDPRVLNDTLNLNRPTGIAYRQFSNQIWVVETGAHRIAVLDKEGNLVKYFGQRGTSAGEFNFPTFIWIDKEGIIYILDSMNFRVQVFNSDGNVLSIFGESGDASGYFSRPKGIATDSFGHIYVVDALFHTVQVFDRNGKFLHNFGRQGQGKGEFWMPTGIHIDGKDRIYIADSYNSRIQIFQLQQKELNGN